MTTNFIEIQYVAVIGNKFLIQSVHDNMGLPRLVYNSGQKISYKWTGSDDTSSDQKGYGITSLMWL